MKNHIESKTRKLLQLTIEIIFSTSDENLIPYAIALLHINTAILYWASDFQGSGEKSIHKIPYNLLLLEQRVSVLFKKTCKR